MPTKKIKVIIADFDPITIVKGGKFSGFEFEFWQKIAKELKLKCVYSETKFVDIFDKLKSKKADVAMAGITKNAKREEFVDFSHNTFNSGLGILTTRSKRLDVFHYIKLVFNKDIRSVFILLSIFILVSSNILWLAEQGADNINNDYFPGIFEALWWSVVTVSTVGYGDFVPTTWLGRTVGSFVILSGLGIFGLYIAKVSSAITLHEIKSNISSPDDLKAKKVATKRNTTSVKALQQLGATVIETSTIKKAYKMLAKETVEAVVFDAPVLYNFIKEDKSNKFILSSNLFRKQVYGFSFPENSPLREQVNRVILKLKENGEYKKLYQKWFGDQKFY